MTAMERIQELEKDWLEANEEGWGSDFMSTKYTKFLLKAFKVMREIAIQVHAGEYVGVPGVIDKEFEERMAK